MTHSNPNRNGTAWRVAVASFVALLLTRLGPYVNGGHTAQRAIWRAWTS